MELIPDYDVVLIEWVDSWGGGGWRPVDEILKDHNDPNNTRMQSVGLCVAENDRFVTIIQSLNRSNSVDNFIKIPKVAIVNMEVIRKGSTDHGR